MKTLILAFMFALMTGFAAADPDHSDNGWNRPSEPAAKTSLYARLGGYDAIVAVSSDFLRRLGTDPKLGRFFVGLNDTSKSRVFQHVVDFLVVATGGPGLYTGQSMKQAHTGLGITGADFDIAVKLLIQTLDKFKVPGAERGQVLAAIGGLRNDIVEKP